MPAPRRPPGEYDNNHCTWHPANATRTPRRNTRTSRRPPNLPRHNPGPHKQRTSNTVSPPVSTTPTPTPDTSLTRQKHPADPYIGHVTTPVPKTTASQRTSNGVTSPVSTTPIPTPNASLTRHEHPAGHYIGHVATPVPKTTASRCASNRVTPGEYHTHSYTRHLTNTTPTPCRPPHLPHRNAGPPPPTCHPMNPVLPSSPSPERRYM